MSETSYHTFDLNLSKDFLKNIHSHRLIAEVKDIPEDLYEQTWRNTPEVTPFKFGGIYNQQFTSSKEIEEFNKAFDTLLQRKSISSIHKEPLLYLIRFLEQDFVKQAIYQSQQNKLRAFSDFLSNLYINGVNHIASMDKKNSYTKVRDPYNEQIYFAKAHLAESMDAWELVDYVPHQKNADDIIKYLTVPIGAHRLYIPKEMIPLLTSSSELKSISGETIPQLNFPDQFNYYLIKYTVETMMQEHAEAQTEFYKLFQEPEVDIRALKAIYKSYRKYKFSNVRALTRIGVIVTDYFIIHKLFKSLTDTADFLWEYFALFNAYETNKKTEIPRKYADLTEYYIKNNITKESIRLMMKDAHKFGDF